MRFIETKSAPSAIGPYSQAVEVQGVLYCSGQIPIVPETGELILDDMKRATEQVLKNISAILAEAGLTKKNIVKTTVFLADMNSFSILNTAYETFFEDHKPARAAVEVSCLPKNVQVEIEGIAVLEK